MYFSSVERAPLLTIDQLPLPYASSQCVDPLRVLLIECMARFLTHDAVYPIRWAVGDSWVEYDHSGWTIGADEPATAEQVRELVVRSCGVVELLDYP